MASKSWTDADEKAFQEMAQRRSSLQGIVLPVTIKSGGSMTDASKRRATELKVFENSDPEWDESEFGELSPKVPMPKVTETFVPTLPEGVNTMEEWGQTQFAFGKYQKERMSYGRAYEEDPAYAAWSKTHLVGPQTHGAALDWGEYVRARRAVEAHRTKGPCYAGTSMPREFVK